MTEQDIPVSDNFQPAPGVNYEETPAEQPSEPDKVEEKAPEPTVEPAKPEAEPEKPTQIQRPQKAKPIADLLEKKHSLETELENERKARQELETKLSHLSSQPPSQAASSIQELVDKYQVSDEFLAELVSVARQGLGLPKEVQDLVERQREAQVEEAENKAFISKVDKLKTVFKDEPLDDPKVREKLQTLAYSTDKAPDGEPYYKKELSELYFAYIKPEVEPGKVSAESSYGAKTSGQVLDLEEISQRDNPKDIDEMDDETFRKYTAWEAERNGRTPLRRK